MNPDKKINPDPRIMKWECNACADTEGQYCPCKFENSLCDDKPEFCPHSKEECEWESELNTVEKKSINNEYRDGECPIN